MPSKWRRNNSWVHKKIVFTVDEGKGRPNPSRYKNEGKHSRRKVEKSCATFLLCDLKEPPVLSTCRLHIPIVGWERGVYYLIHGDLCFIAVRTLWLNLSARCLSSFTGRFNRPTPSDSTPSSRLWCIPTQCAALPFLSGLSPLRSPLLHNPGVHAGALGFNPMLLPKLDQREIPRSRDRGNSYRSNPGSPSIRGSGSCLRLCRVVFACYTPTGGSRPTPAGAGQGGRGEATARQNSFGTTLRFTGPVPANSRQ